MSDDATNVLAFAPRQPEKPSLVSCEFRLHQETFALEMTLRDGKGNVAAVLFFGLESKPADFDLDLLREAWSRWRAESSAVS